MFFKYVLATLNIIQQLYPIVNNFFNKNFNQFNTIAKTIKYYEYLLYKCTINKKFKDALINRKLHLL